MSANELIIEAMIAKTGTKVPSPDTLILQPTTYKLSSRDFTPAREVGKDAPVKEEEENDTPAEASMLRGGAMTPPRGRRGSVAAGPTGGGGGGGQETTAAAPSASPDSDAVFFSPSADLHADRRFEADTKAIAALKRQLALMRVIVREKNSIISSLQVELDYLYQLQEKAAVTAAGAEGRGAGADGGSPIDTGTGRRLPSPHRRSVTEPGGFPDALLSPLGRASVASFSAAEGGGAPPSTAFPRHRRSSSAASISLSATVGTDIGHALELAKEELVRKEEEAARRDLREAALVNENEALKARLEEALTIAEMLARGVSLNAVITTEEKR